jgi:hypothetical protein
MPLPEVFQNASPFDIVEHCLMCFKETEVVQKASVKLVRVFLQALNYCQTTIRVEEVFESQILPVIKDRFN